MHNIRNLVAIEDQAWEEWQAARKAIVNSVGESQATALFGAIDSKRNAEHLLHSQQSVVDAAQSTIDYAIESIEG